METAQGSEGFQGRCRMSWFIYCSLQTINKLQMYALANEFTVLDLSSLVMSNDVSALVLKYFVALGLPELDLAVS